MLVDQLTEALALQCNIDEHEQDGPEAAVGTFDARSPRLAFHRPDLIRKEG